VSVVETPPHRSSSVSQNPMPSPMLPTLGRVVLPETVLMAVICLADLAWTIIAVHIGIAKESNPLLATVLMRSTVLFAIVKLVSFLFPLAALELIRIRRPHLVTLSLRVALIAYVLLYVVGSLHVHGLI
jgi:hypothetical protein